MRDKAAQIAALRIQGHSDHDIAGIVGLAVKTVKQYLYLAGKNGWLRFDDPGDRLNFEMAHQAVDNVHYHLKKKDKLMTVEYLKGTGFFKGHQTIKSESEAPNMMLALKIEMPEPKDGSSSALIKIPPGAIAGKPRDKE